MTRLTRPGPQRVNNSLPILARHRSGSRRSSRARVCVSPGKSRATMMRLSSVLIRRVSPVLARGSFAHHALDGLDRAPLHAARAQPVQVLHFIAAITAAVHGAA